MSTFCQCRGPYRRVAWRLAGSVCLDCRRPLRPVSDTSCVLCGAQTDYDDEPCPSCGLVPESVAS